MRVNIGAGSYEGEKAISEIDLKKLISKESVSLGELKKGQIFDGTIKEILGERIKILLSSGSTLEATLSDGVNFNLGERAEFLVKSNSDGKILLKVLSEDVKLSKSMTVALENLGIKLSEENVNMIKEMMSYGMKLDKTTISNMERQVKAFPETKVAVLVEMKNLGIPVTKENIEQFEKFKVGEGKLQDGVNQVKSDLNKMFAEMAGNNLNKAENFLERLAGDFNIAYETDNENAEIIGQKVIVNEADIQNTNMQKSDVKNSNLQNEDLHIPLKNEEQLELPTDTLKISNESILQKAEKVFDKIFEKFKVDVNELEGTTKEQVKEIVKNVMEEISKDTERLLEHLRDAGEEKSEAFKSLQDVRNNLSFTKDINEFATYIQIPLKFEKSETNGELYVYKRNRKVEKKDGPLTAFLHLTMDNLGATDVSVTMTEDKVTTMFTLEDKISADIVESHFDMLRERLEKLGYKTTLSANVSEEKKEPFNEITEMINPRSEIKKFSFDVSM